MRSVLTALLRRPEVRSKLIACVLRLSGHLIRGSTAALTSFLYRFLVVLFLFREHPNGEDTLPAAYLLIQSPFAFPHLVAASRMPCVSYTKSALLGLLVLSAIADCSDASDIPLRCYEACDACCEEQYAERMEECKDACAISPVVPAGFPKCSVVEGCPMNDLSEGCQVRSRVLR